jgi:hypothetical protein
MSTTGLSGPEKQAYDTVLRAGVYENGKPCVSENRFFTYS